MNRSPLRNLLFLLISLELCNCNYQPQSSAVPLAVAQHFATLSAMDQPVKVVVDAASCRVYWLSFTGEIYRARPNGSNLERIIGGVGASQEALFVQDFCVDSPNHRIVFTDLRDSRTGYSAIKQASLSGTQVSTLVSLPKETPYEVGLDARTGRLYYLTKESRKSPSVYRLRTLGQEGALLVSSTKIHALPVWSEGEDGVGVVSPTEIALAKR